MRPDFTPNSAKHDEDIFSDEEIDMETVELDALLRTHLGSTRDTDTDTGLTYVDSNDAADTLNKQDAMNRSDAYWKPQDSEKQMELRSDFQRKMNCDYSEKVLKQLKKEVTRSQNVGEATMVAEMSKDPSCKKSKCVSGVALQKWFAGLTHDSQDRKTRCNAEQKMAIKRVIDQILIDDLWCADKRRKKPNQFIRLLHGGPGTGKSHVIKFLKEELFEKECGWISGVDFQFGAFQAVNAESIDGDTLHHALGLTPFGGKKKKGSKVGKQKLMDAAKRVSHWRWLIIDEVSMISANVLAELDMHLRAIMSQVSITKRDTQNIDRPFGGINILFVGDFHQLDPPSGTLINAIPTCFIKNEENMHQVRQKNTDNIYFLGNWSGLCARNG